MKTAKRSTAPSRLPLFTIVMLLCFLVAAALQYNDPDPVQWMLLYLAAAACCALYLSGRSVVVPGMVLAITAVVWSLALLPDVAGQVSMQELFDSLTMKTQAVEEAREIGGLWLVAWNSLRLAFKAR